MSSSSRRPRRRRGRPQRCQQPPTGSACFTATGSQPRANKVATPAASTASGSRAPPATNHVIGTSTRELAHRRSGEIEVSLLWHPDLNRVELCILDRATDVSMNLDVAPDRALDAFHHPYAYMAQVTSP